ncbi:MAG: PEP-CTERM sorting domain-containing protein [Methylococcales bacterium]|nr:PEP-CTERM sorting domain-containing protein [Methylococcales bacterium]
MSDFMPHTYPYMWGQQIQFTSPQTEAAFTFQSIDGAVGTFQALLNNIVVETASAPVGNYSLLNYFYGFSNIKFDAISISTNDWPAWIIDDIQLASDVSVPEPETYLLMGVGLLGIFAVRNHTGWVLSRQAAV